MRTDRRNDWNRTIAFRNFVNAPKKLLSLKLRDNTAQVGECLYRERSTWARGYWGGGVGGGQQCRIMLVTKLGPLITRSNIWRDVQIINSLIIQYSSCFLSISPHYAQISSKLRILLFSPLSCHLILLRSKRSPQLVAPSQL
jgi:hypothetical protein